MSCESEAGRTSGRATGHNISRALAVMAACTFAISPAFATGDGAGHIVAGVCVAGGVMAGIFGGGIMRLPPIGRLFLMIAIAMAIVTATAATVDLGRPGW
jgi:hypothetical protein